MEFSQEKPIYLQIVDWMGDKILREEWRGEERIPSVRDVAMLLQVNPNTAMRAYDALQSEGVIYNKRGIGYFVSSDARDRILVRGRGEFTAGVLPGIFRRMALLGLGMDDINKEYERFKNNEDEDKH